MKQIENHLLSRLNNIGYDEQRVNPFLCSDDILNIWKDPKFVFNYTRLKFKKCHLITNKGFQIIFETKDLRNVESISFNNCTFLDDETLEILSKNLPKMILQSLTIKDSLVLTDAGLENVLKAMENININKLNISKCGNVSEAFISKLATNTNLKLLISLKLSHLKIDDKALETICKSDYVYNVRYFDISGCNVLTETGLLSIAHSLCFGKLETLILDDLNQITSFSVQEIIDSVHGAGLKALSLFNCNLIDDKIFAYLITSQRATSIEYLVLMSRSITNWKSIIPYLDCENIKSLRVLKIYQSFNQNEYAMDKIDEALAESTNLSNLIYISVSSEMKLKKFLKSSNSNKLQTAEFIPYSILDKTIQIGNKDFSLKEMRSYLKYHRDKPYQNEDFLKQIGNTKRLLLSHNENITADGPKTAHFFNNLETITLLKLTDEKLLKSLFLDYDYTNLKVLQIIHCSYLQPFIELLCSYELKNLHTLNLSLIKTHNNNNDINDNPSDIINKISRAKLPKLHTLIINDQSLAFKHVENLFISPIMDTVKILKLKSTKIGEESSRKASQFFKPKQLQKLKVPEVDISFIKFCLNNIKDYFQLHIGNITNKISLTSTITDQQISFDLDDSPNNRIILPKNIEIIANQINPRAVSLAEDNSNVKFYLKTFEFSHIKSLQKEEIDNISKYFIPYVKNFCLDPHSKEDAMKYLTKSKHLIIQMQRIQYLTISWNFKEASFISDQLHQCKISKLIMTGDIDDNFFIALRNHKYIEYINIQTNNIISDVNATKDAFEEFLKSSVGKNLIRLEISGTEWFNDDYLNILINQSNELTRLRTLYLIRNTNISTKAIIKLFKNSRFYSLRNFSIGDLKNDFKITIEVIDIIQQSCFRKLTNLHFEKSNDIFIHPNIQDSLNVLNYLNHCENHFIKIQIVKIYIMKLFDMGISQDIITPLLKDAINIMKYDKRFLKKIKLNAKLLKLLMENYNDMYYDPSLLCVWYNKVLTEKNILAEDEIIEIILNKNLLRYVIKYWGNYDRITTDAFVKVIQSIKKINHMNKIITQMSNKFCVDEVLTSILNSPCIGDINPDILLQKFKNTSRNILINVLKLPQAQFSLEFFLDFCDQLKPFVKNVGETIFYNVPYIKSLVKLDDVFIDKVLKYFQQGDEQLIGPKIMDIYPKVFNVEAYDIVFTSVYSFSFIYLFKNSLYFNNLQKLTIYVDPSLILQEFDEAIPQRIIDLNLVDCSLNGDVIWMKNLKNLKKLSFVNTKHDISFIKHIQKINLQIEELELNNLRGEGTDDIDDLWMNTLTNFKNLRRLAISRLRISNDKLHEILTDETLMNIEYLTIKYLPYFTINHLKTLGIKQPSLKYFELGLHQITNQYLEVVAKNPHLPNLQVFKIECKDKSINFARGLTYILNSTLLRSFHYDDFFIENGYLVTDEFVNLALNLNRVNKFQRINLTKSKITSNTFIRIISCLEINDTELAEILEKHTYCTFFNNDVYHILLETKYHNAINKINLDNVYHKLKITFLKQIIAKTMKQFTMRKLLSDYHDQITNDFLDFLIKFQIPIIELGIIIQLNSKLHKNINNLKLNQLISTYPYQNIPLAYEWAIIDIHWRNMLEFESIKIFMDSIQNYLLVFPHNNIDFENNIYLTSNGNVEVLQDINNNNKYICTKYLDDKFQTWQNEVFNDRYNYSTLERDDACGEYIMKLLQHAPFTKILNLKNKNYGDILCSRLSRLIMHNNQKGIQYLEQINLNDNPRITNVGLKNFYSTLIMDDRLNMVNVYCDKDMRKSNLDLALSVGIHDTLKIKYTYYYYQYKKKGLHVYDNLCITIAIYSVICFPLALMQCYEDKVLQGLKQNRTTDKCLRGFRKFKSRIFRQEAFGEEIILDKDNQKRLKFVFTKNCVELNNFLGNPLLWSILLSETIIYYFICFFIPIKFVDSCEENISWLAYIIYSGHAIVSALLEFFLIYNAKKQIADINILDTSIVGVIFVLIMSAIARFNLFTDMLFMTTSFICGYNNIGIASLVIIIINASLNILQIISIYYKYTMLTKTPFYDTYLSLLARFAYTIDFKAVSKIFEKFSASSAIKIGEYYIPQILLTNLICFFFNSIPQGILQFIKLLTSNTETGVSSLALAETLLNFILMFNSAMRIKPSLCTPEMIDELSRSIRSNKIKAQTKITKKENTIQAKPIIVLNSVNNETNEQKQDNESPIVNSNNNNNQPHRRGDSSLEDGDLSNHLLGTAIENLSFLKSRPTNTKIPMKVLQGQHGENLYDIEENFEGIPQEMNITKRMQTRKQPQCQQWQSSRSQFSFSFS